MEILYSAKFARQYKKLPEAVQNAAEKKEAIFRTDPFDSRLKTHKLSGALVGFYAFSVNQSYRIIFDIVGKKTARLYEIGTHDIYR